ncbi:MAG: dihydrodipicolinate synthase family protein [Pirellulales bacterium]
MARYQGIWPAMVTPLDESGEPNLDQVDRLVAWFIEQGVDGLYILGSTGQWPLLNPDQRQAVAERVVRVAAGRIPVMVHVGAVATGDAVALARHAERIGADAVSCVGPIYFPARADVVFEHYRQIGAASELPLFVYHLSLVNQLTLGAAQYAERLLELPRIAGMKFTDRDLYQFGLIHSHAPGLVLFSGADEVMCQAALCGAVGAIGTFYNVWPAACRRAREAFVAGSFETGRDFMLAFQTAIAEVLESKSMWSFLRAAIRHKSGIDVGPARAPLGLLERPWSPADVERIVAQVDGWMPDAG